MPMQQIFEESQLQEALTGAGRKLVVVAFTSGNCGPCRVTTPLLESMCAEMPDIMFLKIDVRKSDEFVEHFQITGVPAFYFYRHGNMVYKFQGGNTDFLKNKIEELRFR